MSRYTLSWKIGGEAGFGIKSSGIAFAKVCNRAGYEVFSYDEYPSLIRGGHNTHQVTVGESTIYSTVEAVDVLVALTQETIDAHCGELSYGAAVLYDKSTMRPSKNKLIAERHIRFLPIPFAEITTEAQAPVVARNIVALGASVALVGLPFALLATVIKHSFSRKKEVLEANLKAARLGYEYYRKNYGQHAFKVVLTQHTVAKEVLLTGNDAIALGALAAGLQFYAAYPMTPSSSILHFLAAHARGERIIVKHAEDEISVINMALGASHVGSRAMVGTSGGGFSLMVEALGLAGITETPLVIVEAQRPGPATGLPTWTEQGDLRFVLHAAQGEFPRIVLAPGDHEECFYLTAQAFNWAEQYQVPVIILTDKFLGESYRMVAPFDLKKVTIDRGQAALTATQIQGMREYQRYRVTDSGISPRSIPGTRGGEYLANSDEHDEYGFSSETIKDRISQQTKRMAKLSTAARSLSGATLYGDPRARRTIVAWGSSKGPVLDALAWLPDRLRRKINFLHVNILWPFPAREVSAVLGRSKRVLLVENNATAQLGGLIREQTGIHIRHHLLKFDGRPIYPAEIKERIEHL